MSQVEAHDPRLIPEPAQPPKHALFARLMQAMQTGIDAPGAFGRHVRQRWRTPRSAFYEPKAHRGGKYQRARGPGTYSELDLAVGEMLEHRAQGIRLVGGDRLRKLAEFLILEKFKPADSIHNNQRENDNA